MKLLSRFLPFLYLLFLACLPGNTTASKCEGKDKASALIELSKKFINEAKSLYPNCVDSNCEHKEQSSAFLDIALNLISQLKTDDPNCPDPECPKQPDDRPKDCAEILGKSDGNQKRRSGVYTIWPRNRILSNKSISVYCDMDTDGGGWTVIQRRGKFSTPKDYFYKDWAEYKKGFGNITQEFWLGNDYINALSNQANYSLRIDLKDANGGEAFAKYDTFWIEDETADYTLHVGGYTGNAGDAMSGINGDTTHDLDGMKFSTKNRRNDYNEEFCAVDRQGAWWYNACGYINLNGLYQPGVVSDKGCTWHLYNNGKAWVGLAGSEIKIRS